MPPRSPLPFVLVIDAERAAGTALTHWLVEQGYRAVLASSLIEARAMLGAVEVDAIVGDLALSDGSFLALGMSFSPERRPVLIGFADVAIARPPELDACLVRPIDRTVLARVLAARFGRRRSGAVPRVSLGDPAERGAARRPARRAKRS